MASRAGAAAGLLWADTGARLLQAAGAAAAAGGDAAAAGDAAAGGDAAAAAPGPIALLNIIRLIVRDEGNVARPVRPHLVKALTAVGMHLQRPLHQPTSESERTSAEADEAGEEREGSTTAANVSPKRDGEMDVDGVRQGLTLVHFSAQPKPFPSHLPVAPCLIDWGGIMRPT